MSDFHLRHAVRSVRAGGVIAYPTEAVFGLGCDPANQAALKRLLAIKRRPIHKGVILIAACLEQFLSYLLPLDAEALAKVSSTWPGPVTWLIPARPNVPKWLRGQHSTLAVRVTAHPLAAALCRLWGRPLVSTSANLSGRPPARTALAV